MAILQVACPVCGKPNKTEPKNIEKRIGTGCVECGHTFTKEEIKEIVGRELKNVAEELGDYFKKK